VDHGGAGGNVGKEHCGVASKDGALGMAPPPARVSDPGEYCLPE